MPDPDQTITSTDAITQSIDQAITNDIDAQVLRPKDSSVTEGIVPERSTNRKRDNRAVHFFDSTAKRDEKEKPPTPSDEEIAEQVAQKVYGGGTLIGVANAEQLIERIQEYQYINHLVIHSHGAPSGDLTFAGKPYLMSEITAKFTNPPDRIGTVAFEGCTLGNSPLELISFARKINAKKVNAWTLYRNVFYSKLKIESPATEESIRMDIEKQVGENYQDYFLTTINLRELASRAPGSQLIFLEFFSTDYGVPETIDITEYFARPGPGVVSGGSIFRTNSVAMEDSKGLGLGGYMRIEIDIMPPK